ncbi:TonB-dependent receptor domain-containing protein [Endozoicomonas sp. YOMI1]|uniref:TonB-dependent receptor domain-containing protein n=1 Tax=Endozoicomonas sp. YOMI1 TaxID=2828739 RepID=UPI0021478018|nr:TonB-dependent receptor [Endozoicomonas sp. YOMI1]
MSFNHRSIFIRTGVFIGSRLSIAVVISVMSSVALAEEVYELGRIIVTAARTAQTVDETLAPVTVINREQIERSQASSVTELLKHAPGVQIASNGGPGSTSGVFLRGTSTAQTLILMDGQKLNSGANGAAPLEYLDPDQIERIEIVRGPRSTLYGADAVGGVINIITRKGTGAPKLTVKAGGGSRGTGAYGLNFGGESEGTRFNFGAHLFETQGYDRTTNKQGSDGDDDAFRNKSISGSLTKVFDNDITAGVNASHTEGKAEYDNVSDYTGFPVSFFETSNMNAFVSGSINESWYSRLEAGYQRNYRDDAGGKPPFGVSTVTSKRYSAGWVNDIAWGENQFLTSGIDYSNDRVDSTWNYKEKERYNVGIFAQNTTSMETQELQISGRYDKNEAYGDKTTGSASWAIDLPEDMRFIASYGTAFRTPAFRDLNGNSDLKPESSKNAEIELRGQLGAKSDWSINFYHNDMTDMFLWNGKFGSESALENTDATIKGIELSGTTVIKEWAISGSVSFLKPEFSNGTNAGKTLNRRARQLFAVNADKDFGRWTFGATLKGQGAVWDSPDNETNRLPGFGTLDLRATVKVTREFKTQFKVVNLMDKDYSTAYGYIEEPRGVFATLIWSPEL